MTCVRTDRQTDVLENQDVSNLWRYFRSFSPSQHRIYVFGFGLTSALDGSRGATFDATRIEFAMVCAVTFALIMTLCWMKYMLQRKPRLSPKDLKVPVGYLQSANTDGDDSSLSADSGESSSSTKGSNGSQRSKESVPNSSNSSDGSRGSKESTESGGSTESSKEDNV